MKAITAGSAIIDIIATINSDDIERMTLHNVTSSFLLLEPGRKVDAESVTTHTGGGAVNAAVSLARQGYKVSTLVRVGRDLNADKLFARLDEEGIGCELISVDDKELTAVSVLISSHDHNAAIFTHRGANGYLKDQDIPPSAFAGADLVYVTNLSNASVDRFPDLVSRAKAASAFVAVNPGIRQLTNKTDAFFNSLGNVDLFICNMEEARALVPRLVERTGWEKNAETLSSPGGPIIEVEGFQMGLCDYAARIHSLGPRYVGVTAGSNGAYVSDDGQMIHQPAMPVHVVGTVGAGDAFASTLSGCLAQGFGLSRATSLAARNAAAVVGQLDAQSGLMAGEELLGSFADNV